MSDEKFKEALDAVFEEGTSKFSPHLRGLLEQLFLELATLNDEIETAQQE